MQSRTRVAESGVGLDEYLKPRVTTDSSAGGLDSVNYGVRSVERGVELPSAQKFARAWAIVATAAPAPLPDAPLVEAKGYVVDAESAYSFLVVQAADLWMQAFVWWGNNGACGFATDRRMGFGGSFAPNRFQRTTKLVCASVQKLQSDFDTSNPLPAESRRWSANRRAAQRRGDLPDSALHTLAKYIQSFIDDFNGVTLNDPVSVPDWLRAEEHAHAISKLAGAELAAAMASAGFGELGVGYESEHMAAAGCLPSPCDSRVGVHARLTAVALRRLGFCDAPLKMMVGSPLLSLGLRIDGVRRSMDCPPTKQENVLADAAEQLDWATAGTPLRANRRRAHRLTGRLCNLSQVAPERCAPPFTEVTR